MSSQPAARMVDVTGKETTAREATATGRVCTTAEVVAHISDGTVPKGDVFGTARVAGIMATKRTPDLLPLCHPIAVGSAVVDFALQPDAIDITATVRTADRTGVEMEALTAVAVAALTIVDMVKALDPAATIDAIKVQAKSGGKTGAWQRPADR